MQTQQHEPEIKTWNKARGFQNFLLRLYKSGVKVPDEAVHPFWDWLQDEATVAERDDALLYCLRLMWGHIIVKKINDSKPKHKNGAALSESRKAEIREKEKARLDRLWLDVILGLTGAQIRAAKALPDELANQIPDDKRCGEVFAAEQLKQYAP